MLIKDRLVKEGNFLFRWRSFIPLIMVAFMLVGIRNFNYIGNFHKYDLYWEIFCLFVSFLGLLIRIITIGHVPKGTSGRNTKKQIADTLNTTGMYSIVRNPLYLGNFFMYLGIVMFLHNFYVVIIFILFFWNYYERIIIAEEEFLRSKFGNKYIKWAERTPAFIPNFKLYKKADLKFSFRNVLKREYNGFFGIAIVMFVFEILGDYHICHRFIIDDFWNFFIILSFVIWISLRILKKHTNLLKVKGR